MIIRTILISTCIIGAPLAGYAHEHENKQSIKTNGKMAQLTVKEFGKTKLSGEKIPAFLNEALSLETNAENIQLHVIAISDNRILKTYSSDNIFLRTRPGHVNYSVKNLLPSADYFKGLTVANFTKTKPVNGTFSGEDSKDLVAKTALKTFEKMDQSDGIFIVTTWDDMVKGDGTIGLVGFGSWN